MIYLILIVIAFLCFVFFTKYRKRIVGLIKTSDNEGRVVIEVRVPRKEDESLGGKISAMSMEGFFAGIHGLLKDSGSFSNVFSFEIVSSTEKGIHFYVTCPREDLNFVESQLYAHHPAVQLKEVADYVSDSASRTFEECCDFVLLKDQIFPFRTFNDIENDALSAITSTMSQLEGEENMWFQILCSPSPDVWQKLGHRYLNRLRSGKINELSFKDDMLKLFATEVWSIVVKLIMDIVSVFGGQQSSQETTAAKSGVGATTKLTAVEEAQSAAIENKMSKMGFWTQVRLYVASSSKEQLRSHMRSFSASLNQYSLTNLNSIQSGERVVGPEALTLYKNRVLNLEQAYILNSEELATLFHLPSYEVETPSIDWAHSRKSEPPSGLPTSDCTYIGETVYRNQKVRFGLANNDDRLRHMYVIGKSGTGKSTLFETMISQDIANGFGVGVLDPHGETIDKILDRIPSNRVEDVIYFDPADTERPLGLNLLELTDMSQKNLMASALVAAIMHHFEYSWGPRLEYLLNYSILTLLEVPGTTMLGITRLLEDDNYRKFILHFVKDPVVLKFWDTEFKNMKSNQKLVTEAIAPIQNKVNRFLASTTIRNILGQKSSTLDLWDAMNSGKIVLMNLSKGKIGEDNANLLGALLVSRIQFMALQRANIPYEQRRPFYLYVDEFQNFATGSFESILSESRKYGLGLYLTHQYTAQLPEQILKAVLGNVGTIVTFALGTPDARALSLEFAPFFSDTDIIALERFHVYMKLMIDGMTSSPFSAKILLPWKEEDCVVPKNDNKQWVYELSRQKYGVDRVLVEDKISKWVENNFDKGSALALEQSTGTPGLGSKNNTQVRLSVLPKDPVEHEKPFLAEKEVPLQAVGETPASQSDTTNVVLEPNQGRFDGFYMIDEQGNRFEVPQNYSAKSELVYGDVLEKYDFEGQPRFRQVQKMVRKSIDGVVVRRAGEYFIHSDGTDYALSKIAVEFNFVKEGALVSAYIPENLPKVSFATLDTKKLKKIKKQEELKSASKESIY